MFKETEFEKALDKAAAALRASEPDAATAAAAAARVWEKLNLQSTDKAAGSDAAPAGIGGCADIQALLPAYRAGTLPESREWLVQDHIRECPACRAAAQGAANRPKVLPWREAKPVASRVPARQRYAWAAAVVATVGLGAFFMRDSFLPAPEGPRASLEWSDGPVFIVDGAQQRVLARGASIEEKDWFRTAAGTRAMLRLRDGSEVEVNQLAELKVTQNRKDTTIHLERGAIIVEAAKRHTGHLYVATRDTSVAVTGTVFAVNRSMKGTRVAVVEGSVYVEQNDEHNDRRSYTLTAGTQATSTPNLQPVSVRDEIAWSKNAADHAKLLTEFAGMAQQIEAIHMPGLRYESKLLNVLPPDTVVYAAIPNLGEQLAQAQQIFEERMRESDVLRQWWAQTHAGNEESFKQSIEFLRTLSEYLGDEVVVAVAGGSTPHQAPVVLAEVRRNGLREFIDTQLTKLHVTQKPPMVITDSLFAISPDQQALDSLHLTGGLAQQPFGQRIAQTYKDGAGIVFCADLSRLQGAGAPAAKSLGTDEMQYLVVEQRSPMGRTETKASLNFAGPRHGIASWLAAPAPIGSLDFVSPNASLAAAFVVKQPAQIIDDLFQLAGAGDRNFNRNVENVERQTGVRIRDDIAASLGNDITVSLDGPALPTPSWKVIVEVHDAARIEQALERFVAAANAEKAGSAAITKEQQGDRTIYTAKLGPGFETVYTFSDGYMIWAANMDTLRRGLRAKEGFWTLPQSNRFRSLLPVDAQPNFSAVIYHNLTDVAAVLGDAARATGTPEQQAAVARMAALSKPGLIYAYGLDDRIQVASTSGFFGLTLENLIGSSGIAQVLEQHGGKARSGFRNQGQSAKALQVSPRLEFRPVPPAPPVAPRPPRPDR